LPGWSRLLTAQTGEQTEGPRLVARARFGAAREAFAALLAVKFGYLQCFVYYVTRLSVTALHSKEILFAVLALVTHINIETEAQASMDMSNTRYTAYTVLRDGLVSR
jgi:hypothetical protein